MTQFNRIYLKTLDTHSSSPEQALIDTVKAQNPSLVCGRTRWGFLNRKSGKYLDLSNITRCPRQGLLSALIEGTENGQPVLVLVAITGDAREQLYQMARRDRNFSRNDRCQHQQHPQGNGRKSSQKTSPAAIVAMVIIALVAVVGVFGRNIGLMARHGDFGFGNAMICLVIAGVILAPVILLIKRIRNGEDANDCAQGRNYYDDDEEW